MRKLHLLFWRKRGRDKLSRVTATSVLLMGGIASAASDTEAGREVFPAVYIGEMPKDPSVVVIAPFIVDQPEVPPSETDSGGYTAEEVDTVYRALEKRLEADFDGSVDIVPRPTGHVVAQPSLKLSSGNCYSSRDLERINQSVREHLQIGKAIVTAYLVNDAPICDDPARGTYHYAYASGYDGDSRFNVFRPGIQRDELAKKFDLSSGDEERFDMNSELLGVAAHEIGHSIGLGHVGKIWETRHLVAGDLDRLIANGDIAPAMLEYDPTQPDEYASYLSSMGKTTQGQMPFYTIAEMSTIAPDRYGIHDIPFSPGTYEISVVDAEKPAGVSLAVDPGSGLHAIDAGIKKLTIIPDMSIDYDTGVKYADSFIVIAQGDYQSYEVGRYMSLCTEARSIDDYSDTASLRTPLLVMNGFVVFGKVEFTRSGSSRQDAKLYVEVVPVAEASRELADCRDEVNARNELIYGR